MYTALLAGLLKACLELAASIHLDGLEWERQPSLEGIQEGLGSSGRGPGMNLDHVPAGDHIPCGEMLEDHPRQGADVQGVHLDQVPWLLRLVLLGLAHCIGAGSLTFLAEIPLAGGSRNTPRLLGWSEYVPPWRQMPAIHPFAARPPACLFPSGDALLSTPAPPGPIRGSR